MKIAAAASAFPQHYYSQDTLLTAMREYWGEKLPHPQTLDRLHLRTCVEGRHLARPLIDYYGFRSFGDFNSVWIESAVQLGSQALCKAVNIAGVSRGDIGAIFFVSVTGIASPSIDAKLINKLKLSPNTKRIPIFGLGCVAGAAGIARAADYVKGHPSEVAALVSVELCSLTLQREDLSVANLISAGLFGDGAAAVLIAGSECEQPGPRIIATKSTFYPDTEDVMGWDISERGFNIVLSPSVPKVVKEHLGADVDAFLAEHDLTRADIGAWIMHTGGPKVLESTQEALGIGNEDLAASWECLRKQGNLSSASVLCVLEEFMTRRRPDPGTWSVLAAMGPGFCSELVLLQW